MHSSQSIDLFGLRSNMPSFLTMFPNTSDVTYHICIPNAFLITRLLLSESYYILYCWRVHIINIYSDKLVCERFERLKTNTAVILKYFSYTPAHQNTTRYRTHFFYKRNSLSFQMWMAFVFRVSQYISITISSSSLFLKSKLYCGIVCWV